MRDLYNYLVVIVREGVPEATGFCDLAEAQAFYDLAEAQAFYDYHGAQWSESYLCEVVLGPKV